MTGEPVFGIGLDDEAIRHCLVLAETSDITQCAHLLSDHGMHPAAISAERTSGLILAHMHLHGRVYEAVEDPAEEVEP